MQKFKTRYICTVCGKTTMKPKGGDKHPICTECFTDETKRKIWLDQLKEKHPGLYEIWRAYTPEANLDVGSKK